MAKLIVTTEEGKVIRQFDVRADSLDLGNSLQRSRLAYNIVEAFKLALAADNADKHGDTMTREDVLDDFTRKHLKEWASGALQDEEREDLVRKIIVFVEQNPEVIARSWSWPDILEVVQRNERLGL